MTQGGENGVLSHYEGIINSMSGINYIIDRNYRITVYSKEKWDEFAKSNDGEELTEDSKVKNKLVLDHFAGERVREYYKQIYDLILEGKKSEIVIRAKCDAPEALRDNVLYLTPIYEDPKKKENIIGVLHQSLILRVEERPEPVTLLKRRKDVTDGEFLEMCSICKNVKYFLNGKEHWISPEEFKEKKDDQNTKLDHSICDECTIMLDEFM